MQDSVTDKARGEVRAKRRDDPRSSMRKKRGAQVVFSAEELAHVFRARGAEAEPHKLLPSPGTFLRQMRRTFQSEFPGVLGDVALAEAIAGR